MIKYDLPGSVQTVEPNWEGVPWQWRQHLAAVCHSLKDCEDLVYFFDNRADFCPQKPVLLVFPDGTKKQVCGLGFATAAELRDVCVEVWGVTTGKLAKTGSLFDFDDLRERSGQMRREDVAVMAQYAFHDRVKKHKASPVTDPWKQFKYNRPTNPVQFVQPDNSDWKGN